MVEYVIWCKKTAAARIHSSQGQYLRHSKEILLIAIKWKPLLSKQRSSDVIISKVLQQSRKPQEVNELLEKLAPGVKRLEIFVDGGLFQVHLSGKKKFDITRALEEGSVGGDGDQHSEIGYLKNG
eukprot:snap_masked-scaffold_9-processed-gene-3.24-mRNA-1 protein AED:1.00 eAED:1.00 QI:0/0/0/0/1/1/3/0/124